MVIPPSTAEAAFEVLTATTRPVQKPVPRSNQSLFLSSYTLTRFLSFGGGTTSAIAFCDLSRVRSKVLVSPLENFPVVLADVSVKVRSLLNVATNESLVGDAPKSPLWLFSESNTKDTHQDARWGNDADAMRRDIMMQNVMLPLRMGSGVLIAGAGSEQSPNRQEPLLVREGDVPITDVEPQAVLE